ncbi:hypothetical protein Rhopal_003214-T1 [Rhodotorula paludigena]|uniref:Uncharacterized protein n=1 Tax=Rhodotorula paludigena TaxID=86838 RepID=A0AAV5GCD7_9BASI|nr:hypothetical protein Rhopal_003214-T1 [Rhodotorula paludigena]
MGDLWLRGEYPIGPFAQQPPEQAVADVLAKAPWAAWSTSPGGIGFRYTHLDRPEAGTALLALVASPHSPPDGLRYLYTDQNERRTLTRHTVHCPVSVTAPTQQQPVQVDLECFTAACGHFPPLATDQPLPPGSPERLLTRFRKRWRITNGQYPSLWFFWWGRDETGGMGQGSAPTAPHGWDSVPARQYPLQRPPNTPTNAIYPFPAPGRTPGAPPAAAHLAQQQQHQQQAQAGASPYTAQQKLAAASASNPYARQQQLAALATQGASLGLSGAGSSALEARQAQFQAQQQAMVAAAAAAQQQQSRAAGYAAAAAAAAAGAGGGGLPGYPPGMTPQQMQQQAQAQQQAYLAASRGQRKSASGAPGQAAPAATAAAAAAGAGAQVAAPGGTDEPALSTDVLDHLSPRHLAIHRYALQHDLLAPVFDAWSTTAILEGRPRKRDMEEVIHTVGISRSTGEPRGVAVPGFHAHDGVLAGLGTSAARIAVRSAMEQGPDQTSRPLEERRKALEQILQETQRSIERMEKQHQKRMAPTQPA